MRTGLCYLHFREDQFTDKNKTRLIPGSIPIKYVEFKNNVREVQPIEEMVVEESIPPLHIQDTVNIGRNEVLAEQNASIIQESMPYADASVVEDVNVISTEQNALNEDRNEVDISTNSFDKIPEMKNDEHLMICDAVALVDHDYIGEHSKQMTNDEELLEDTVFPSVTFKF